MLADNEIVDEYIKNLCSNLLVDHNNKTGENVLSLADFSH